MRINAITQPIQSELRKVEISKKTGKNPGSTRLLPGDRTEISEDAERLNATKASIEVISAQVAAQDDIRSDRISEVQEKIRNGYYDSPEFLDRLASKLLAEFGVKLQEP